MGNNFGNTGEQFMRSNVGNRWEAWGTAHNTRGQHWEPLRTIENLVGTYWEPGGNAKFFGFK